MKVDEKIRQYQSTVAGDAVKMSIDESATAHIMDVLTKLYADPELAIIREYSTNALDSHVEAGVNRPIEVTLPTSLSPFLTIRDYGIGLDADGINNIYSRYGTSTKRGSNEAVGMLGLGCKSALSYTDQFTLTGFKDGVRTEVLISRDEDGAGSMTIVDQSATPEGNGVKVTIPVKRENDVAEKAHNFFQFWNEGTVLVNGKAPERIGSGDLNDPDNSSLWLDDRTLLTTEVSEDLVVMGNVPYPLVEGEAPLFAARSARYNRGNWHAVCFVDIGDVNFAPSRESLMTTKRTKEKLAELRATVERLRDKAIYDQIAAAPDALTAQQLLIKGRAIGFNKDDATWKGQTVVLDLRRERPTPTTASPSTRNTYPDDWSAEEAIKYSYLSVSANRYSRKQGDRVTQIDLKSPRMIFENFDGKWLTTVKRDKLTLWCQQEGVSTSTPMLMLGRRSAHEKFWTSGWDVRNWQDVEAIVLPKTASADGTMRRIKGSYDIVNLGSRETGVPAAKIAEAQAAGTPVYWMQGNLWTVLGSSEVKHNAVDPNACIIVALAGNRIDKFCRDFPEAKQLRQAATEAAERWVKSLDEQLLIANAIQEAERYDGSLKSVQAARVDDPELRELCSYLHMDTSVYRNGNERYSRWLTTSSTTPAKAGELLKVKKRYPLLTCIAGTPKAAAADHLHLYLNAAYKAEKGGN